MSRSLTGPEWLHLARKEIGTKEIPGPRSNPTVEQYFVDSVSKRYGDEVSWCAAFVGACLVRAGRKSSGSLLARSYLKYGRKLKEPIPGAIGVWPRGKSWQGHVGIVDSVEDNYVWLISGNQQDAVTRARYPKRNLGYRWPLGGKD